MALKRVKDSLPAINRERSAEVLAKAYGACASVKDKAASIDVPQVASAAKDWMAEHPYRTGFYVASGVLLVVPGLATAPALGLAGFSAQGVAGGRLSLVKQVH